MEIGGNGNYRIQVYLSSIQHSKLDPYGFGADSFLHVEGPLLMLECTLNSPIIPGHNNFLELMLILIMRMNMGVLSFSPC